MGNSLKCGLSGTFDSCSPCSSIIATDGWALSITSPLPSQSSRGGCYHVCFPATHITSHSAPAKGCFGPLKMHWRKECWEFLVSIWSSDNWDQFSAIFQRAWSKSMTMTNIVAGFRTAGVYPVNRVAVEGKKVTACESLAERTGLSFIPLYSPSRRNTQTRRTQADFDPDEIALFRRDMRRI